MWKRRKGREGTDEKNRYEKKEGRIMKRRKRGEKGEQRPGKRRKGRN